MSKVFGRKPRRIVICYRREDAVDSAGRLLRDLRLHFDRPVRNYLRRKVVVVRDFDNIPAGINYEDYIRAEITASVAVLVVIGNDWLKVVSTETGQRRIDDPDDPLRKEIVTALSLSKPVIPVLVEKARMPSKENLPDALKELAPINAREVYDPEWDAGVARLIKDLESRLSSRWANVGGIVLALAGLVLLVLGGMWGVSKLRGVISLYGRNSNANVATPLPSPTGTPKTELADRNEQRTPTATPTPAESATPTPATPTPTPATPTPTPVPSVVGTQWDVTLEGNIRYVWDFLPEGRLRSRSPEKGTYLPDGKWEQNGDSILVQTSVTTPNPETYTGKIQGDRMEGKFIALEEYDWFATRKRR